MAPNRTRSKTVSSTLLVGIGIVVVILLGVGAWLFRAWAAENLGLLNLIVALAGFGILWRQVYKATSAAEASEKAAESVSANIVKSETLTDVTAIRGLLNRIIEALRGQRFETALIHVQTLRESLHQLRLRHGFIGNTDRKTEIQAIVTTLARYQKALEERIADGQAQVNVVAMNTKLAQFVTTLAEWSEQQRFDAGEVGS